MVSGVPAFWIRSSAQAQKPPVLLFSMIPSRRLITLILHPPSLGTAMFTFGLAQGINGGYLSRSKFLPVVLKAWQGLYSTAYHADSGLVGFCQPVGGGPANATSTDTSDFCVGQFLLAGSEVARL